MNSKYTELIECAERGFQEFNAVQTTGYCYDHTTPQGKHLCCYIGAAMLAKEGSVDKAHMWYTYKIAEAFGLTPNEIRMVTSLNDDDRMTWQQISATIRNQWRQG